MDELRDQLSRVLPAAEVVHEIRTGRRATVARVAVGDTTYIAKRNFDAAAFANECAGLTRLPAAFRPELVAQGETLVVMEDLGDGPSLADVLLGTDPVAAERGLLAWADALGAVLAPSLRHGRRDEPLNLDAEVANIVEVAADLGVTPPDLRGDLAVLTAPFDDETDWFAFGPSDACPDNNRLYPDGSIKFFDFEGASWRHAASEGAYTRAPFCTCWCVGALPDGMTAQMEAAFLAALGATGNDEMHKMIGASAIAYVLQTLKYFRYFLEADQPVAPPGVDAPSSGRQYVHARMRMVAGYDAYPALAGFCAEIADAMATKWPACTPLPLYRAFR